MSSLMPVSFMLSLDVDDSQICISASNLSLNLRIFKISDGTQILRNISNWTNTTFIIVPDFPSPNHCFPVAFISVNTTSFVHLFRLKILIPLSHIYSRSIQSSQSQLYLKTISRNWSLLTPSVATTLVQATIISYLVHCGLICWAPKSDLFAWSLIPCSLSSAQ